MPTPVFTWFPVANLRKKVTPNVTASKFGDGYEQRVARGLNTTPETWSVEFEGAMSDIAPIEAFLRARNAVEAFEWKTPDGDTLKFICRTWDKARVRGVLHTLSCDFEQVFE